MPFGPLLAGWHWAVTFHIPMGAHCFVHTGMVGFGQNQKPTSDNIYHKHQHQGYGCVLTTPHGQEPDSTSDLLSNGTRSSPVVATESRGREATVADQIGCVHIK